MMENRSLLIDYYYWDWQRGLPHFPHWDIDRGVGSSSRPAQRGSAGANEYGRSLTELSVIIKFAVCVLHLEFMAISYLISRNGSDRLSYSSFEDRDATQGTFIWNDLEIFFRFYQRDWSLISIEKMHARWRNDLMWQNKTKQYQGTFLGFPYQRIGHEPEIESLFHHY
jgi:hypothetical protein